MRGCAGHRGQARRVASGLCVVLCNCAAIFARGVCGLEANVVGLDVCHATLLVIAGERILDLVCDLA
jgi:hypothetical protein